MPDEPLWTANDVARFLAVSPSTVRCWQRAHRLPFFKIGGTVRFFPDEVRRWPTGRSRSTELSAGVGSDDAFGKW